MVVLRHFAFIIAVLLTCLPTAYPLSAQDIAMEEGFAEVNGISIHYRTAGSGPPLLLLHGYTGAGNWWDSHLSSLAENYTVIVPDMPGHGRSGGRSGPYRFDLVAEDLLALMSELDVSRFHAVGYSGGGIALLHMATIDPERIDAMVVVSAPHQLIEANILAFPAYENHPEIVRTYWQEVHPGGETQVRELIESFHGVADIAGTLSLSPEQLATIQARTLLVGGDRDPLVPLSFVMEMYGAIPDAAIWVIPAQGHSSIWPDWGGSENAANIFSDVVTRHLGPEPLN